MPNRTIIFLYFLSIFFLYSCKTAQNIQPSQDIQLPESEETIQSTDSKDLTILFGGDIMSHEENYNTSNYADIWKDVTEYIHSADLALANIETPIDDSIPYEAYPTFNTHHEYIDEAIKAGFSVFSLCNNHTNDQGITGILQTQKWIYNNPSIYASGLKNPSDEFSFNIIEKNGWSILFLPITEILNAPTAKEYINYVPPSKTKRADFITYAKMLRQKYPCDLFIISIHTAEPEYIPGIQKEQKNYYYTLLEEAHADVIWANHPHIVKEWEIIGNRDTQKIHSLIMYANGNTISGQRRDPQFKAPATRRDYTGDGILVKATFTKNVDTTKIEISNIETLLITTYITPTRDFVLKPLRESTIQNFEKNGNTRWAHYLQARLELMNTIQGIATWH
ncbi:MAG: CapA family protein [Treponema sp.]|nr:CapA family protein [Treponema sp.]